MDTFESWKLFFEADLIKDVKTAFRLRNPHGVNFWWKHIKNESCKWYLNNKEQKAVFLVVSRTRTLVLSARFLVCPKSRAPRKKFVYPCFRSFLARCRSFRVVSCSLWVVSSRCRSFQVVPRFIKYPSSVVSCW